MGDREFYRRVILELQSAKVPFQVGGALALRHYFGLERETKDLDLFLRPRDVQRAIDVLNQAGCDAKMVDAIWLAKVFPLSKDKEFVDLIFNGGNGLADVDDIWFEHGVPGWAFGLPVEICPAEETIFSKSFVMTRDRYDGADIYHLMLSRGSQLDWGRLLWRFGENWQVLLSHLLMYRYVYPKHASQIPHWVMRRLLVQQMRAEHEMGVIEKPRIVADDVCRGTLLSRTDYSRDLSKGFEDGRKLPGQDLRQTS